MIIHHGYLAYVCTFGERRDDTTCHHCVHGFVPDPFLQHIQIHHEHYRGVIPVSLKNARFTLTSQGYRGRAVTLTHDWERFVT